jgi:hypothetical protein
VKGHEGRFRKIENPSSAPTVHQPARAVSWNDAKLCGRPAGKRSRIANPPNTPASARPMRTAEIAFEEGKKSPCPAAAATIIACQLAQKATGRKAANRGLMSEKHPPENQRDRSRPSDPQWPPPSIRGRRFAIHFNSGKKRKQNPYRSAPG